MAEQIIKSKMQQKRGTSAEIASSTEVLLDGEIIYDKTNNKFKVGNGSSQIKDLPYLKGDGDYLPLSGGTMSGPIQFDTTATVASIPDMGFGIQVPNGYTGIVSQGIMHTDKAVSLDSNAVTYDIVNTQIAPGTTVKNYVCTGSGFQQMSFNGFSNVKMNSQLLLAEDPTQKMQAATKQYVDENVNGVTSRVDSLESAISNISTPELRTVTLTSSGWTTSGDKFTQTETVSGISSTETAQLITVTPKISNMTAYYDAGVYASSQSTNSLTFTATTKPTSTLTVYVIIQKLSNAS